MEASTKKRRRPSVGMILGFSALFVALSATAVASVPRDSVGTLKIKNNSVRGQDVRDGSLRQKDLAPNARAAFKQDSDTDTISEGGWLDGEDVVVDLPAGERTEVGTLDVGAGDHVIVAQATVSSSEDNDNLLCFLHDGNPDDPLAVGNARALRESFALTALTDDASRPFLGLVTLECRTSDGDGTATDISITSVEVEG